jgi:hypothetical protein
VSPRDRVTDVSLIDGASDSVMNTSGPGRGGSHRSEVFATIGAVALAILCCGFPLLAGALAATGVGVWWLVGLPLLALVPLAVAAAIIWRRWRPR